MNTGQKSLIEPPVEKQPTPILKQVTFDRVSGQHEVTFASAIDPTLTFGTRYKGFRLSQVSETYLRWLVTNQVELGERDWAQLALQELTRRSANAPLPAGLPIDDPDIPFFQTPLVPVIDLRPEHDGGLVEVKEVGILFEEEDSWSPWKLDASKFHVAPETIEQVEQVFASVISKDRDKETAARYIAARLREAASYGEVVRESNLARIVVFRGLEFSFKKHGKGVTLCQLRALQETTVTS